MFKFIRRNKQQEQAPEPTLRELCDAVAAHPDSVVVAVFDRYDFVGDTAANIDHDQLREDIYNLVMAASSDPIPF